MKKIQLIFVSIIFLFVTTNAQFQPPKLITDNIPPTLSGEFKDDYGIRYSISDTLWIQHPNVKYHIISWNNTEQYLLAINDNNNPGEKGLCTRIDYMTFKNMVPFEWGFCLTVYNAKTLEEAKSKPSADRKNPKKGCGGFPFSRMKRVQ